MNLNSSEILQQTVAVIEAARTKVAKVVVSTFNKMHWNVGRILITKFGNDNNAILYYAQKTIEKGWS